MGAEVDAAVHLLTEPLGAHGAGEMAGGAHGLGAAGRVEVN